MANQMVSPPDINFTDRRKADPAYQSGASSAATPVANIAETASIATLRTALNAFDAFTYTNAELDRMSVNDMIFAWRMCRGNQASISDYQPAQVARVA